MDDHRSQCARKYVRMARSDGYDALRALPSAEQLLFSIPKKSSHGKYQERFVEWATAPEDGTPGDHDSTATRSQALIGFRSQLMWDSTMADSIAKVLEAMQTDFPDSKVVHLIGQFHSDFEGGTIQELHRPGARRESPHGLNPTGQRPHASQR